VDFFQKSDFDNIAETMPHKCGDALKQPKARQSDYSPISLDSLKGLFVLYAFMHCVGVISFVIEFVRKRHVKKARIDTIVRLNVRCDEQQWQRVCFVVERYFTENKFL
jgi:hypothetical protein